MSFDFDAAVTAPFRMQPGLRRIAPGVPQLTPLQPGGRHQREKLAVLGAYPDLSLQRRPDFDAAPALAALAAHAAAEHPTAWSWDGRRAVALQLGTAVSIDAAGQGAIEQVAAGRFGHGDEIARCLQSLRPAWRLAGLLSLAFEEDFAIVDAAAGTLPWLAVTLPSHWAPEDKLGKHFTEVHAPVADNALVLRAADALLHLMAAEARWERFVWNVTGHPHLHAHPAHVSPQRWPAGIAQDLPSGAWWRTERQTFIPLPAQCQAVFTIRVDVRPLAAAISTAAQAARLHAAIASMSPAVLAYRGLPPVRDALLRWLASVR